MPFDFEPLTIPGVQLIRSRTLRDARGIFMETYKQSEFAAHGITEPFVQENYSSSARGVLRGLHFQRAPYGQSKLVRVVSGTIFDVAVDVRADSATAGQWVGVELSAEAYASMFVPSWCAHGFCVLSERAEVVYHTSTEYSPSHEAGIMWNDAVVGITWPIANPIVSERDTKWPPMSIGTFGGSSKEYGDR